MLEVLLVDDSLGSLRTLRNLLKRYCPQVTIVGEASSPEQAYELMLQYKPNLLLLDVEMPLGSGFDLIKMAKNQDFEVIFVTAHEQYALEAIRHKALDYLLKPIGHISLMESIEKAEQRLKEKMHTHSSQSHQEPSSPAQSNKLPIPTVNGFEFIEMDQIIYLEADGIYTDVHSLDKKRVTTSRMGELEEKLKNKGFFRIHRSYIVNLARIIQYLRGDGGTIIMENSAQLPVARNRKEEFLKKLGM